MIKYSRYFPVLAILFTFGINQADAAILYDSLPASGDLIDSTLSDRDNTIGDFFTGHEFELAGADDFQITQIDFAGRYTAASPPSTDNFTIQIYTMDGVGDPSETNTVLDLNVGDLGRTGGPIFSYSATLSHIITPGTYLLHIVNDTQGANVGDDWLWMDAASAAPGSGYTRGSEAGNWAASAFDQAFRISGNYLTESAVPEPSSLALMGLALVGAVAYRRKNNKG